MNYTGTNPESHSSSQTYQFGLFASSFNKYTHSFPKADSTHILPHIKGREPMAREPDIALLKTVSGSLVQKFFPEISSKSIVAIKHALSKTIHTLSLVGYTLLLKAMRVLLLKQIVWLSWNYILNYAALMVLFTEKFDPASDNLKLLFSLI